MSRRYSGGGGGGRSTAGPWSEIVNYGVGDFVSKSGVIYVSNSANNLGNDPETEAEWDAYEGAGPQGVSAYTVTTDDFTQPAEDANVTIEVASTSWMAVGQPLYIGNAAEDDVVGYYTVITIVDGTHVTVRLDDVGLTGTIDAGAKVVAAGLRGATGDTGAQGDPGATGETGATGATGAAGSALIFTATSASYSLTAPTSSSTDTTVYTVPASPSGNGRALLTGIWIRLKVALVGSGSVALTVGTSAGGTQLLSSQTINSSSTVGTDYGLTLSTLGASFDAAKGYVAVLAAGATVSVRLAATGTVTTPPQFDVYLFGVHAGV